MTMRRRAARHAILSVGVLTALAGCAAPPMGPTIPVMPGPGKSFESFQIDQNNCKMFASDQVRGQTDAVNQRAVTTGVLTTVIGAGLGAAVGSAYGNAGAGAAIGAAAGVGTGAAIGASNTGNDQMTIQQQYDNAFAQCMYAKGEQVPGFAPRSTYSGGPAPTAEADPLVRSTQSELIRLGYLQGGADGVMGPKTRSAISSYQQSQGLPADGAPSQALVARLQATPANATASAPTNWVAPAGANGASPAPPSGWVQPAAPR